MNDDLARKAASLPTTSGVYLFKGPKGTVLYVGKAVNLRSRVRQYLSLSDQRSMVPHLVADAHDVEVVLTNTEKEALLLENTLIKKYLPRYNTQLRDNKNFLHLRIDPRRPWPRYTLVRRLRTDGAKYFGPYHSANRARETLAFLQRVFPLRTCTDAVLKSRRRPCLLHQMDRCVAPCVPGVDADDYASLVEESMLFLKGRKQPLIERLQARMMRHADDLEFEKAARTRDLIRAVKETLERQQVVDPRMLDRDIWGLYRDGERGVAAIVPVREGLMGEPLPLTLDGAVGDTSEVLSSLLNVSYPDGDQIPPEILVPELPADAEALVEVLSERKGRKVSLRAPKRGDKLRMVELATENARVRYLQATSEADRIQRALEALAEAVGMPVPPHRIDCFDNSNLQGTDPVSAMAVFIQGKPEKSEYRRYKVKTVIGADDYATMREVLQRRLRRGLSEGNLPDLLVVDGGKGQLGVARAVLQDFGLDGMAVIGISKPRTERRKGDRHATDKIVLPDVKDPVRLPVRHPGLRLLQQIRDEVHRFAVAYHRKVRRKNTLTSVLESVPGVGPARRKALLRRLGSARAVSQADQAALAAVPGIGPELATAIYAAFHPEVPPPSTDLLE